MHVRHVSTHAVKTVTNFFDYMFIKCIILHPTYNTLDGTQSQSWRICWKIVGTISQWIPLFHVLG